MASFYDNMEDWRIGSLTAEIIMEFAFARSAHMIKESQNTFKSWFLTAFNAVARSVWKMQEWPIARKALGVLTYECSNSHRSPDRECGQNAEGWRRLSYTVFRSAVEMLSSTLCKQWKHNFASSCI